MVRLWSVYLVVRTVGLGRHRVSRPFDFEPLGLDEIHRESCSVVLLFGTGPGFEVSLGRNGRDSEPWPRFEPRVGFDVDANTRELVAELRSTRSLLESAKRPEVAWG